MTKQNENERHYDVVFQSDDSSNNMGFKSSYEYCKDFITANKGRRTPYFEDYKGGSVTIVCIETEEVVFEEEVK